MSSPKNNKLTGRGGANRNQGRKLDYGEKPKRIGVPESISHDLKRIIDELLIKKGWRGSELIQLLESIYLRKYNISVSAGLGRSESLGGDSVSDSYEEINLFSTLIPDPSKMSIVEVAGDSMIDVGIYEKDWLIVRETKSDINDGDIVVVSINGQTLVKRYSIENGQSVFLSENSSHSKEQDHNYAPIYLSEESVVNVTGVVETVIRRHPSKVG